MEQLAQFVTKSFEFNNCFSAKILEAKQRMRREVPPMAADGLLSCGMSSSSASNESSSCSENNPLAVDVASVGEQSVQKMQMVSEDPVEVMSVETVTVQKKEEEDEDEIDIETDSVSAFEDHQGVVGRTQETCERLRVIQPKDLRVNQEARSPGSGSGRPKDVNNNQNGIKPPITKNWLIPEDTSE